MSMALAQNNLDQAQKNEGTPAAAVTGELFELVDDGRYVLPSLTTIRRYAELANFVEEIATASLLQGLKSNAFEPDVEIDKARRRIERSKMQMTESETAWVMSAVIVSLNEAN